MPSPQHFLVLVNQLWERRVSQTQGQLAVTGWKWVDWLILSTMGFHLGVEVGRHQSWVQAVLGNCILLWLQHPSMNVRWEISQGKQKCYNTAVALSRILCFTLVSIAVFFSVDEQQAYSMCVQFIKGIWLTTCLTEESTLFLVKKRGGLGVWYKALQ